MNVEARIDYAPVGSTPQIDSIWVQACVKEAAEEGALNSGVNAVGGCWRRGGGGERVTSWG